MTGTTVAPFASGATRSTWSMPFCSTATRVDRVHRRASQGAAAAVSCVLVTTSTQSAGVASAGSVMTGSGGVTVRPGRSSVNLSIGLRAQPMTSWRPASARQAAAMPPMLPRPTTATV